MNKVIQIGCLTRDPDVRYSQAAEPMAVAKFSIAVNRKFKREGEPEADFFNVTAFGKLGQFVEKYLKKGTKIALTGKLQNNNYTDKNGVKRYEVQIIAEEIEFAGAKKEESGSAQEADNDGFVAVPDSAIQDLPFK